MESGSDSYYISEVKNGKTSEFRYLVEKYQDMVFTIALRISRNREDAEEIAQDVFLKCFRSLHSFREDSRFSTWLYRIAYNESVSRARKKRKLFIELAEEHTADMNEETIMWTFEEQESALQHKHIEKTISELSEIEQVIVTLFYYEGNSIDEIAEVTVQSVSNVKVRLHRIRKKLQVSLGQLREELIRS